MEQQENRGRRYNGVGRIQQIFPRGCRKILDRQEFAPVDRQFCQLCGCGYSGPLIWYCWEAGLLRDTDAPKDERAGVASIAHAVLVVIFLPRVPRASARRGYSVGTLVAAGIYYSVHVHIHASVVRLPQTSRRPAGMEYRLLVNRHHCFVGIAHVVGHAALLGISCKVVDYLLLHSVPRCVVPEFCCLAYSKLVFSHFGYFALCVPLYQRSLAAVVHQISAAVVLVVLAYSAWQGGTQRIRTQWLVLNVHVR